MFSLFLGILTVSLTKYFLINTYNLYYTSFDFIFITTSTSILVYQLADMFIPDYLGAPASNDLASKTGNNNTLHMEGVESSGVKTESPGVKAESPGVSPAPSNTVPGQRDNTPSDDVDNQTDWSDGEPLPATQLRQFIAQTLETQASSLPEHKVQDPERIAPNYNPYDTTTSLQPFASNMANYLYNYKRGPHSLSVSGEGFPKLDPDSLRFLVKYMNHEFPDHYGATSLKPLSNHVIHALDNSR